MARREWAEKRVDQLMRLDMSFADETDVVWLLKLEHARVVRIVKARDKWLLGGGYDNMSNDFQAGYHQACNDLLAALTKGRA